jgi:methylated-DNA-[protein]-cysteine S-methyltransferase
MKKTGAFPAAGNAVGDVWVETRGARVTLRQGTVVSIDLLPLGGRHGKPVAANDAALKKALKEVGEFLEGTRKKFTVPFKQSHATAFHEKIYAELMQVPYGRVVSYGELARLAGAPRAARAVGSAMKRNRIPLIVPCHRVVASHGIGGYGSGLEWKKVLLGLESAGIRR